MTKYAKKNLKVVRNLEKEYKMSWRRLWEVKDWTDLINYARLQGLACSICGGQITTNNLKFYKWDVSRVKCYKCSKKIINYPKKFN